MKDLSQKFNVAIFKQHQLSQPSETTEQTTEDITHEIETGQAVAKEDYSVGNLMDEENLQYAIVVLNNKIGN